MPSTLSGRTVLVTGATSGIGYATARRLVERGATVLLHGRVPEEARTAADRLIATAGIDGALVRPFAADFTRLEEVERLAHAVVREQPHLDVLVNNAAIAAPERHTLTADGNEIAFQVNFLAHYLLTNLLEPALTSEPGRSPASTARRRPVTRGACGSPTPCRSTPGPRPGRGGSPCRTTGGSPLRRRGNRP